MSERVGRVAVIGGGVTGLTTAYQLLRDAPATEVVVLEASERVGGKIATEKFAERPVDCAADAFLARVPEAVELCHELGLTDDMVTPASRKAYVFAEGELRPFPEGLVLGVPTDLDALARSRVVSAEAIDRVERDLTMAEPSGDDDESVGQLVRRRVGDEVFETLVAPLLSGVYAGNADHLSAEVAAPQFVTALRDHGSLVRGLRAQLSKAKTDAPVFYGLRGGMEQLVDLLAHEIDARGGRIECGSAIGSIEPRAGGVRVDRAERGPIEADAAVLTTPGYATAQILKAAVPDVARALAGIPYSSVAVVALAVDTEAFDRTLDGTGFLVPEREGLLLTACTWASSKWAHLRGETTVLRASVGRIGDERAFALGDDELVAAVVDDLRRTMDLPTEPSQARVSRWPRALPQFSPGHLRRVDEWRDRMAAALPGVFLAGAGIGGLGIPACIRQARRAADEVGARLA